MSDNTYEDKLKFESEVKRLSQHLVSLSKAVAELEDRKESLGETIEQQEKQNMQLEKDISFKTKDISTLNEKLDAGLLDVRKEIENAKTDLSQEIFALTTERDFLNNKRASLQEYIQAIKASKLEQEVALRDYKEDCAVKMEEGRQGLLALQRKADMLQAHIYEYTEVLGHMKSELVEITGKRKELAKLDKKIDEASTLHGVVVDSIEKAKGVAETLLFEANHVKDNAEQIKQNANALFATAEARATEVEAKLRGLDEKNASLDKERDAIATYEQSLRYKEARFNKMLQDKKLEEEFNTAGSA